MSEEDWFFDDPEVPDDEELLRRIPWQPNFLAFDAQEGKHKVSTAAFRQTKPGEGLSVHMRSVVEGQGLSATSVYDEATAGTVAFLAGVPRTVGAGVVAIAATEEVEANAVLRAAHAEVRPPTFAVDKSEWSQIRSTIVDACRWVVAPEREPGPQGKLRHSRGRCGRLARCLPQSARYAKAPQAPCTDTVGV